MLQYGMRQTAETVAQMTSIERILQFTKLEKEGPFESTPIDKPSSNWPIKGEIRFDRVSLRYAESQPAILKSLSFVIEPGMKVNHAVISIYIFTFVVYTKMTLSNL